MKDDSLQFPALMDSPIERYQWPVPPFAWRHVAAPANDVAQSCHIEGQGGAQVEGEMLDFDPAAGSLSFRSAPDRAAVTLPFARIRRLKLTEPLRPAPRIAGAPIERVPAAAQVRLYTLQPPGGGAVLTGSTAGQVETAEGLYLFDPIDDEMSVQRLFVPRSAYIRCEFGPSAEQLAAEQWVATPQQLLQAIEQQKHNQVPLIGQALLDLGLLTRRQLERALTRQRGDVPLGRMLVAEGLLSQHDLQTALAYKIGYPYVDLSRFPVDPAAMRKMTPRMALQARAFPLLLDQDRLIVAVDNLSRANKLRSLHAFTGLVVVPVLASKSQILQTLSQLSQHDVWSQNVATHLEFFQTTN